MHTLKRFTLLCLVLCLATACVKLGGKPLDKKFYTLSPVREQRQHSQSSTVLKVRRLSISDTYNTRELVYSLSDGQITSDFYNLFFVTPGNNLTSELRKWLNQTGMFAHIVEPGSMAVPDLTLEGVVNALYGDYSTKAPTAVVSMQFFLVDESTPDNSIVFSRSYSQHIPLAKQDPQGLVQAMTLGVQTIFTQLETDLAQISM